MTRIGLTNPIVFSDITKILRCWPEKVDCRLVVVNVPATNTGRIWAGSFVRDGDQFAGASEPMGHATDDVGVNATANRGTPMHPGEVHEWNISCTCELWFQTEIVDDVLNVDLWK